jgi:hypothetical protein
MELSLPHRIPLRKWGSEFEPEHLQQRSPIILPVHYKLPCIIVKDNIFKLLPILNSYQQCTNQNKLLVNQNSGMVVHNGGGAQTSVRLY